MSITGLGYTLHEHDVSPTYQVADSEVNSPNGIDTLPKSRIGDLTSLSATRNASMAQFLCDSCVSCIH